MTKKNIKSKIYKYPNPDKIQINKANFELKLRDYKASVKNKFAWKDLLFLLPAWAILLTSNFNNVWLLSGEEVKGIYFAFMVFGTLDLFKHKIPIIKNIINGNNDVTEAIEDITKECE
jgi:hypothetical protein